jgi:uncharacterized damage-inducible protein DinB
MTIAELLTDAFGRIRETVHRAVDGLTAGQLTYRPEPGANSIAWLVWHLTRIQDDHIADVAGTGQVWTSGASGSTWADRFGLPFAASATGYGDGPEAVAAVQVKSGELLTAYYDAVHQQTLGYIQGLTEADLDRVVDKSWDPPVTLGVRLVSVISDDLQHAGQAAYLRGIIERG